MYGINIPLQQSLKFFLEIPGILQQILDYIQQLSKPTEIITNIMQADLWTKYAQKFAGEIVLPLYIYYDELEVRNALTSHAGTNKFGAVYASIACLPPHISSRLDSIIFSTLVYADEKKQTSNELVFKNLIEQLNFLSTTGITVKIGSVLKTVKFQLALILGDNLGLNGICGFVESFKANFYCRICKLSSAECKKFHSEEVGKLRSKLSYSIDIQAKNVSETGIKEECVFNNVPGFHILENITVDIMHDMLEGVCMYVMRFLIFTYVFEKELFTLHDLNTRIQNFNPETVEHKNKSPEIKLDRIKNKIDLKLSAAEMLFLVQYFGLIVGDRVPRDDRHWNLYKSLRQVMDIVLSPRVTRSLAKILSHSVENLNKLYTELCGPLKPKFHHMTRYAKLLLLNGPLVHFWSMRFESSHRPIKSAAQSSSSSTNLLKTIATKQSLRMFEMMNSLQFEPQIKWGLPHSKAKRDYFLNKSNSDKCKYFMSVEIHGIYYTKLEVS